MSPKKNSKFEKQQNSRLYFQIGLVSMLFFAYLLIEQKTYASETTVTIPKVSQETPDKFDEPFVLRLPKDTPPPTNVATVESIDDIPEVIEKLKVVDNDSPLKEQKVASTDDDKLKESISPVDGIPDVDLPMDDVVVPFTSVGAAPIFPGCEKLDESERRACFEKKIKRLIRRNQRYPEVSKDMGIEGKVHLVFTIDKEGNVTNIKQRGPDRYLEAEAIRIIKKLPKMTPGSQRGKPVSVTYAIPFTFKLN